MKEQISIFFSLVSVLFKEKKILGFSSKKKLLTKLSLYLILFAGLTAFIFLLFYLLQMVYAFGLGGYMPLPIFNIVLILLLVFAIFTSVPKISSSLYLAEDNHMLLTYPLDDKMIFSAKLFVYFIEEIIRDLFLFIPLVYAYSIASHVDIGIYFWSLFVLPFISLFIVATSVLLSIPYIHAKISLKKYEVFRGILILLILIGLSSLSFYLINLVPEDLQIVLKWTNVYFPAIVKTSSIIEKYLYPFVYITTLIFNYCLNGVLNPRYVHIAGWQSWVVLAGLIVVSALFVFIALLVSKSTIRRGATSTLENDKKESSSKRKNVKRNALSSIIFHQIILDIRTPNKLIGNYLSFFTPILATLILNVLFKATHINEMGNLLVMGLNFFFIILLTTITNMNMASKISREGEAFNQLKISYKSPLLLYASKMILHCLIMVASIVICVIVYHLKLSVAYSRFDLVLFTFLFVYIAHLCFSVTLDIAHPKRNLYKNIGERSEPINNNEILSGITSLLLSLVFFGLSLFFINAELIKGYYSLTVFAFLFFVGGVVLFIRKTKAYQKSIGGEL